MYVLHMMHSHFVCKILQRTYCNTSKHTTAHCSTSICIACARRHPIAGEIRITQKKMFHHRKSRKHESRRNKNDQFHAQIVKFLKNNSFRDKIKVLTNFSVSLPSFLLHLVLPPPHPFGVAQMYQVTNLAARCGVMVVGA